MSRGRLMVNLCTETTAASSAFTTNQELANLDSANGNSPQSGSHLSNLESTKNVETVSSHITDGDGDFSPDESDYVPEDSDSSLLLAETILLERNCVEYKNTL
ncbi:hypothetical protein QE152_g10286 [Popillia japonica]|uniref:Uncharacterized protein n=1 Tax=Popillia japonica TaxID=7064 RepID=A0AAW1LVY6_POPJA